MKITAISLITILSIGLFSLSFTENKKQIRLKISSNNPHLLEKQNGEAVFINNYTVWSLPTNGSKEDITELISICKKQKFNMLSVVMPFFDETSDSLLAGGFLSYVCGQKTDNKTKHSYQHLLSKVDHLINTAEKNRMYISIHPTWGSYVAGGYNGTINNNIIFNISNAYKYGVWLGKRYEKKKNILWMLGGDRSAIYEVNGKVLDYRPVWNAMAEGLADGLNGINKQDGKADYSNILISYHPRKWAPNSSEWFHNEPWLSFNSIQDTPYDQIKSIPHDYNLKPVKPTWLFEGRYEGRMSAWGIRYQAYQTVFSGGFGATYGSNIYSFPKNWRKLTKLPGAAQMAYLYRVVREIWTNEQFLNRTPDQSLIVGDNGNTYGDGQFDDAGNPLKNPGYSDRITAMRDKYRTWAVIYSANGRDINIDISKLKTDVMKAYWFNPRTGKWHDGITEHDIQTPFKSSITQNNEIATFNPPGNPEKGNDWILVLK